MKDYYVTVVEPLNPILALEEASGTLRSIDSLGRRAPMPCTSKRNDAAQQEKRSEMASSNLKDTTDIQAKGLQLNITADAK